MVSKFTSEQDKLVFLKALPATANYQNLLKTDFGVIPPNDATWKQMEQLWKFLVAFNRNPSDQNEIESFYSDLYKTTVVQRKPRKEKYVAKHKNGGFKPGLQGEPVIKEQDGMFYGYIGDTLVVRSRSKKYLTQCFEKKGYTV